MNRIVTTTLVALALAVCSGCEAKAPVKPIAKSAPIARPALWKVYDADTTVYLFGTIHLLPKGMKWAGPRLNTAMGRSQGLVLETVVGDPATLGATMAQLNNTPGLPRLLDRVPQARRAKLKAVVAKSGISIAALDRMETWAAALAISASSLQAAELSHEDGAEAQLTKAFRAAKKPVDGLESPAQQLGYFDRLSEKAQRQFLVSVADDETDMKKEFAAMIAAWRSGDVRRIAMTFDDEMKLSPELADTLLHKRNALWAAWVVERMKKPGTIFVAVGAGHLAGKDSVEDLIARRGVKVVRVQ